MRRRTTRSLWNFYTLILVVTINTTCSIEALSQINDPRDLTGNVLWLDGADVDGDFVNGGAFANGTTWVDKSTALNANAAQGTLMARPTVVNSGVNNLTVVDFDGDDLMDVANSAFGMLRNVEGATMIGVLSTDVTNSNSALRALMISSGANSAATRAGINLYDGFQQSSSGSGDFGLAGRRLDSEGFQRIEGGNVVAGELAAMIGLFDFQAGDLTLLVNGQVETSFNSFQTPGLTSNTDSLNIRIGADASLNDLRGFFDGQIAELIVYDRVLSTNELELINSYIAQKWTEGAKPILGDVNCDGNVNLLDVAPFVEAISTGDFSVKSDVNQDGFVNLLDVAPFVDLLAGG